LKQLFKQAYTQQPKEQEAIIKRHTRKK